MAQKPKKKPQTGRLLKVECQVCEYIAYSSRGAVVKHGAPEHCGRPMLFADAAICIDVQPQHFEDHPAYVAERQAEDRAARREATSSTYVAMHCGGCHKFIRATNELCSCGFQNDIRGKTRRNYGGWAGSVDLGGW